MPGFGALRNLARGQSSEKKLKSMTIHMPSPGGLKDYIVHHDHHPPHDRESFRFAPNENENLAAHLSKHLGLRLPGKAADESAESSESKSDFQ